MKQPKFGIGDQVYFIVSDVTPNNRQEVRTGKILSYEPAWDSTFKYEVEFDAHSEEVMENELFSFNPQELVNLYNRSEYNETLLEIEYTELYIRKTQSRIDQAKELLSSDLLDNIFVGKKYEEIINSEGVYGSYFVGVTFKENLNKAAENKEVLEDIIKQQEDLLQYLQTDLETFTEKKADLEEVLPEFSSTQEMSM